MFQCNNCNSKFEEPDRKKTTYESEYGVSDLFISSTPFEMLICPNCGDDDLEELVRCPLCREWCSEEELTDTEGLIEVDKDYVCPECIKRYKVEG